MKSIISKDDIEKTVTIRNGLEVTRSDKVAKIFDKQHKHILEKIQNLESEFSDAKIDSKKYFIKDAYIKRGKPVATFWLTRKGFDFVILSLTGKKALIYKAWYIDTFHEKAKVIAKHKLQAEIHKSDEKWLRYREEGKIVRKTLTQTIKDTIVKYRYEVENKSDGKYYYHFTQLVYSMLNIELPKGAEPRDVLDDKKLIELEVMEKRVINMIEKYHNEGLYYKDYFKMIKEDIKI